MSQAQSNCSVGVGSRSGDELSIRSCGHGRIARPQPAKCPLEDIAPRGQRFGCQQVGRGSSVADVGTEIPRAWDPAVMVTQATPLCVCVVARRRGGPDAASAATAVRIGRGFPRSPPDGPRRFSYRDPTTPAMTFSLSGVEATHTSTQKSLGLNHRWHNSQCPCLKFARSPATRVNSRKPTPPTEAETRPALWS